MQISSINDIIQGELQNSPAISFISNVKTNAKRVHEGDLFVAKNEDDIAVALKNGAFAIVTQAATTILDSEIAWIVVDDIQKALIRFIRYSLSQLDLHAFYCDEISYKLIQLNKTATHQNIKLFSNNIEHSLKLLDTLENGDTIFSFNKEILDAIYPKNKNFNTSTFEIKNVIEHSLFETTFSYKEDYFSRIRISGLYLNQFLEVFLLFNKEIDFNKLKKLNHFKPIFIDKYSTVVEYGKSGKFILAQESFQIAQEELAYIHKKYTYGKIVVFIKKGLTLSNNNYICIQAIEEIKEKLKKQRYNAVYIIGFSSQKIENFLNENNAINALL
ncbi:MAG: peptidoglycan synthetase [Candidatus Marinarcus sp.]|uniref:peptidoglycan synthetase n=1 Tax=Candidatus Marinarcus sp. TaxID=3100987 RepID=UPI003B005492